MREDSLELKLLSRPSKMKNRAYQHEMILRICKMETGILKTVLILYYIDSMYLRVCVQLTELKEKKCLTITNHGRVKKASSFFSKISDSI